MERRRRWRCFTQPLATTGRLVADKHEVVQLGKLLQSKDVADRRKAAAALLEFALGRQKSVGAAEKVLIEATIDDDNAVRVQSAQALALLVLQRRVFKPFENVVRPMLASEDEEKQRQVVDALVHAASGWRVRSDIKSGLFPLLLAAMSDSDPQVRHAALEALDYAAKDGLVPTDLQAFAPIIGGGDMDDAALAVRILRAAADHGKDIGPVALPLEKALNSADDRLQFDLAATLARQSVLDQDPRRIGRLLGHKSLGVREGAAYSLANTVSGKEIGFAVTALGRAMKGTAGGVSYQVLRALQGVASADGDLGPAVKSLQTRLRTRSYDRSNWTLGVEITGNSDLIGESPATDAAIALTLHYLAQGDEEGLRALCELKPAHVRKGILSALKRAGARHWTLAHRAHAWLEGRA